jgi:hypothetical protein
MNWIRYTTRIEWHIKNDKNKERFPVSKMSIPDNNWNVFNSSLEIRKNLFQEIGSILENEFSNLIKQTSINTSYKWVVNNKNPILDLHELLMLIIISGKVSYVEGNEDSFIKDFLNFFGHNEKGFKKDRSNILTRKEPFKFLDTLIRVFEEGRRKKINSKN